MNIDIKVIDEKTQKRNNVWAIRGEIQINDFRETIYIPLDWWSLDDYKKQWEEGKKRLLHHNISCLVASIHDPKIRPYINWWLLYKVGNKVYIQNQMIVGEIYKDQIGDEPFTLQNCYDFIPERGGRYDENENEISEWVTNWNE